MHNVTAEKMDAILRHMKGTPDSSSTEKTSFEVKDFNALLNPLDINPYDHYANGGAFEFDVIIRKQAIEDAIKEAGEYPEEWACISEARADQISEGDELTEAEIEAVRKEFVEREQEDEGAEFMTVSEVSDGKRSVFALYQEQMQGQGGNNITEFHGFFETEKAAQKEIDEMKDIIIVTIGDF